MLDATQTLVELKIQTPSLSPLAFTGDLAYVLLDSGDLEEGKRQSEVESRGWVWILPRVVRIDCISFPALSISKFSVDLPHEYSNPSISYRGL